MKYIKNDVNASLLYLLMFAAVFITVVSVVFSYGFTSVYASGNVNSEKVSQLEKELNAKEKALENTQKDIELLKQRLREGLK